MVSLIGSMLLRPAAFPSILSAIVPDLGMIITCPLVFTSYLLIAVHPSPVIIFDSNELSYNSPFRPFTVNYDKRRPCLDTNPSPVPYLDARKNQSVFNRIIIISKQSIFAVLRVN